MKSLTALLCDKDYIDIIKIIDSRVPDSGYECTYIKGKICKGCQHPTCNGATNNFIVGIKDKEMINKILEGINIDEI